MQSSHPILSRITMHPAQIRCIRLDTFKYCAARVHIFWHYFLFLFYSSDSKLLNINKRHWQLIWSKLGFSFMSGITLDIVVFFLWRTSSWSIEDKTYKKVERNPFYTVLENLPEESKHSCLYTSETHWQFIGIQLIYNGRHAESHNSRL